MEGMTITRGFVGKTNLVRTRCFHHDEFIAVSHWGGYERRGTSLPICLAWSNAEGCRVLEMGKRGGTLGENDALETFGTWICYQRSGAASMMR